MSVVNEAYKKSLQLLLANSTPHGFMAATPTKEAQSKAYQTIFGRDASICALGAYYSGEKDLQGTALASLKTLLNASSYFGQIPFYYDPAKRLSSYYFTNSYDGTAWWLIASLTIGRAEPELLAYENYAEGLEAAIYYLAHLANPQNGLITQDECLDWADAMPRHGYVLYTNVLWYKALELYLAYSEGADEVLRDYCLKLHASLNTLLWTQKQSHGNLNYFPQGKLLKDAQLEDQLEYVNSQTQSLPYYLAAVGKNWFDWRCDVYGNILAILLGVADQPKTEKILDWFWRSGVTLPYPVKVAYPPIYPGEKDWRDYMFKRRQNFPWQYHNGAVWPYVGGFWVYLLVKLGYKKEAEEQLEKLAEANALNDWEFNEYLHGQTGLPMGMVGQSWNAATYVLAYQALVKSRLHI